MSTLILLALFAAEPVVLTPLADPDPGFVAPKASKPRRTGAPTARPVVIEEAAADQGTTSLEKAFVNLDKAVQEARESARKEEEAEERELREAEEAARKVQADTASATPQN